MLGERGIILRSLRDGIDPSAPNGRLMLNLLASLAEYERHFSSERIAASKRAARQAGTKLGRPPVDPDAGHEKLRVVEQARARGLTAADAAQLVRWSRAMLYRHQQQHGSEP
jgi:DNA invertase Pin-like site-specific DNA recombinase